jgi:hypothetical protein
MLLLETQQLEGKGTHYYQNGYLCPRSSKTRSRQSELAEASAREKVSAGNTDAGHQHELFMQVNRQQGEEASDFSELWGLSSWPAVFCYPDRAPPLEHWPNIVSLIMDNRSAIDSYRAAYASGLVFVGMDVRKLNNLCLPPGSCTRSARSKARTSSREWTTPCSSCCFWRVHGGPTRRSRRCVPR